MKNDKQTNMEEVKNEVEAVEALQEIIAPSAEEIQERLKTSVGSLELTRALLLARKNMRVALDRSGVANLNNKNMHTLAMAANGMTQNEMGLLMEKFKIENFDDAPSPEGSGLAFLNPESNKLFEAAQLRVLYSILGEDRFTNMTKNEKNELAINGYVILKRGDNEVSDDGETKTYCLAMTVLGFTLLEDGVTPDDEYLSDLDNVLSTEDAIGFANDFQLTNKKAKRFGFK